MPARLPIAPRRLLALLLCCWAHTAFAFQIADGAAAARPVAQRYIFYWGTFQCSLSSDNGFRDTLYATAPDFRSMLLSTPRLWTGSAMAASVSFRINGFPVTAIPGENGYPTQIEALDAALSPNVQPGQQLHITDLVLDEFTRGTIDIKIQQPDSSTGNTARRPVITATAPYLNEQYLQQVVWGREDIHEVSNRDFFAVSEFWQTVQQLPFLEWKPGIAPLNVNASVSFLDHFSSTFGVIYPLEHSQYRQLVQNLKNYSHLIRAGAVIQLKLFWAERYDELFRKTMTIVPDNDPRLSLRRNRDTHILNIRWAFWEEKIPDLYLLRLENARGPALPTDMPVVRQYAYSKNDLTGLLTTLPELRIDGQPVQGLSLRLSLPNDSMAFNLLNEPLPDTLARSIAAKYMQGAEILLDSFRVPGIELPELSVTLKYTDMRQFLLTRNSLEALQTAAGSARIRLFPLVWKDDALVSEFELPEPSPLQLSIFGPDGSNPYLLDEWRQAGRHTVRVPGESFRQKGRHLVFLNTPFGVAKQEILLK